jgi:urate oxidase
MSRPVRRTLARLGVPVLRVDRRGDRHLIRDMVADVRVELPADHGGADPGVLVRAVHALSGTDGDADGELYALAVARYALRHVAEARRAKVEIRSRGWGRLDIGGRPRGRDFVGPSGELRIAAARVSTDREQVSAGFRRMLLLASAGDTDAVTVQRLDAMWNYGWAEVPYETQWQQVRRCLTEAFAERGTLQDDALAAALARAVLEESPPVHRIGVRLGVIRRAAVDMNTYGMENTGSVFGAAVAARTVHEVVLARDEVPLSPT